jgi:hypothetical protein
MNAAVPALLQQVQVMNPLDVLMNTINTNPYFIGLMMLLLNLGGRFLALEISKDQEKFLSQPMVRRFFLFAVLFVATRNIVIAAALAFVVILLLGYLFNENSTLCLWKSCATPSPMEETVQEGFIGLTPEEAMILKRLQDKQRAALDQESGDKKEDKPEEKTPLASDLYHRAMKFLKLS